MRILVAGAGALGSMYGGFLRRAGHEVALLGRDPHLAAIDGHGLAIEGLWGEHRVFGFETARSPAELRGRFDLAIVAVKSYGVPAAAAAVAGRLAPGGLCLALQNGLGHLEVLAGAVGAERVLGAPVLIGAAIPEPGAVRVTVFAKAVRIGAPWGSEADARAVAELVTAAGVPGESTDRPWAYLWEKVLYNAPLNALGAILRRTYGELDADPETRAVLDDVIEEGFAVARASGVELLWPSAEACRRHFHEVLVPPTARHRSSMLQDIERGRRTEVDALNGFLARRGAELGVAAPVNRLLARLVHAIENRASEGGGNR